MEINISTTGGIKRVPCYGMVSVRVMGEWMLFCVTQQAPGWFMNITEYQTGMSLAKLEDEYGDTFSDPTLYLRVELEHFARMRVNQMIEKHGELKLAQALKHHLAQHQANEIDL